MNNTKNEIPDGYVLLERHEGRPLYAACLDGGRFHGWLFRTGPETGQWVSERKLEQWEIMQAEDQRDDNIVHETVSAPLAGKAEQDGYVLMPKRLTAENGAKAALMGEFKESIEVPCPECHDEDEDYTCETCENFGRVSQDVTVGWDTIKDIYARAVELLSAPLAAAVPAEEARCTTCDGTGMVHRADGEYLGECNCDTQAEPAPIPQHNCATCKDTGIVYTGPLGDSPEQCDACFDQEPAPIQSSADLIEVIANALVGYTIGDGSKGDWDDVISNIEREVLARLSKPTAQGAANKDVEWLMQCAEEAQDAPEIATKIRAHCVDAAKREASQSPAQVTGEPASIDTPEFDYLLNEYADRPCGETTFALIAHINRHIASQATAGRDAVLEEAAEICDEIETERFDAYKGRGQHEPFNPGRADPYVNGESDGAGRCAQAIRKAKSSAPHAAEQASGGANASD